MFNVKRASANAIINRVMSNANGIGTSKSTARQNSNATASNGHKVSTQAHSIKEMQNLRTVTKQYINFVKENYSGKVANNINADSAKAFIQHKAQGVTGSTLNTYTSTLTKVADNLNKDNIGQLNRKHITTIKSDLKAEGYSFSAEHNNRAYNSPESIVNNMRNTPFSLSIELQAKAGLRADDALNSDKWQVNSDNTLTIYGSKGGLDYTTAPLSGEIINRVEQAIQQGYNANYTEYREALQNAVEQTGQEFNGTHGLRYTFAQERITELQQQGKSEEEARGQVSLELGHSRLEITNHYTSF